MSCPSRQTDVNREGMALREANFLILTKYYYFLCITLQWIIVHCETSNECKQSKCKSNKVNWSKILVWMPLYKTGIPLGAIEDTHVNIQLFRYPGSTNCNKLKTKPNCHYVYGPSGWQGVERQTMSEFWSIKPHPIQIRAVFDFSAHPSALFTMSKSALFRATCFVACSLKC